MNSCFTDQRRHVLPGLLLCFFLMLLAVRGEGAWKADPRDFHSGLRLALDRGERVGGSVREWIARRGDHSFDSFLSRNPAHLELNRRLLRAMRLEKQGEVGKARRSYLEIGEELAKIGQDSEAAFAFYYAADLAQRESQLSTSLIWLARAHSLLDPKHRQPYLEAVLLQGRAYTLWYLDQLQPSIRDFEAALERYRKLGLSDGIIASWNNLAVLQEELELPERARLNYRRAFSLETRDISPEVEFQLNSNYAFFLARQGPSTELTPFFQTAARLRSVDPFEFALLNCRLSRVTESNCDELLATRAGTPWQQIEKDLTLSRYALDSGQRRARLQRAWTQSRKIGSSFWLRKSTLELGEFLEQQHEWLQASALYRQVWLQQRGVFERQAAYYPYGRAVAPLFAGRIRCLIRSGQSRQAWLEIQEFTSRREERLSVLWESSLPAYSGLPGTAAGLQAAARPSLARSSGSSDPVGLTQLPKPVGFDVLELWSDGSEIFAWAFNSRTWRFRSCRLPTTVSQLLDSALRPLREAARVLPDESGLSGLASFYRGCYQPLEPWLQSGRILVIPHKELQSLPLEVIPAGNGYLGQRIAFSYLPSWREPVKDPIPGGAPVLLSPEGVSQEWKWLRRDFPKLKRMERMPSGNRYLVAPWVHVSSHFRLRLDDWLASEIGDDRALSMRELLSGRIRCGLLSLAVCDGASTLSVGNPYWMGLAEILLQERIPALLVSRWKLDEFSLEIYRGLLGRIAAGKEPDLALLAERRNYAGKRLLRAGVMASGSHPFFWAGISFVGRPDWRLVSRK